MGRPSFHCPMTLSCSSFSVPKLGPLNCFVKTRYLSQLLQCVRKKTKLSPGIFFFNRLARTKLQLCFVAELNYFQFRILNLKTRALAQICSCQDLVCFSWQYLKWQIVELKQLLTFALPDILSMKV